MIKIAYLIHRARLPDRRVNLDRAKVWFQFVADALPDHAVLAPWIAYCESLDEETYRERGMRDGKWIAQAVTGQVVGVVCGPEMTDGCRADVQNLAEMGFPSVTLTDLCLVLPPVAPVLGSLITSFTAGVERAHTNKHRNALWSVSHSSYPRYVLNASAWPGEPL